MATARCISLSVLDINSNLASCLSNVGVLCCSPALQGAPSFSALCAMCYVLCGQFSWLSLYFYLINFIARHRQAGKLSWHPSLPTCKASACLPVVACRTRSRRRFSTLTMTYCRSQPRHSTARVEGRAGTDKGQSRDRAGALQVSLLHWQFFS